MLENTQIGNPYNKNGRLFPNLPGFLLSIIIPKIIEKTAVRNNWRNTPIETTVESKLTVYT